MAAANSTSSIAASTLDCARGSPFSVLLAWTLGLLASGCLAERASTAELQAAAAAAAGQDAVLTVDGGDELAGDQAAGLDSQEDSPELNDTQADATDEDGGAAETDDSLDSSADASGPDQSQDGDAATCSEGAPCDDGDPCTAGDVCDDGVCAGASYICECTVLADCAKKDDGNLCNGTLFCDKSTTPYKCKVDPASVKTCDTSKDGACKLTACVPATGKCVTANASEGKTCDADGSACTVGDACKGGTCVPGPNNCGCTSTSDCASKEDGNLCNGTLFCDKSVAPYACKVQPATVKTCDGSKDGPCEKTACVPASGLCVKSSANEGNACDADGSVCSVGDACKGGVCLAGSVTSCDDSNGCTADGCDKAKGCTHMAVVDGTKCAEGQCTAGACKPLPVVKVWPFGADGDLVFSAPNVITLDADSREPPIWDFAKCNIGGTLKIVGKRSWVLIGCAGDAVIDGTIYVTAGYDVADYKDSKQPDAQGKLTGAKLVREPFAQVGGNGGGAVHQYCISGGILGGGQQAGNGGGGAGGIGHNNVNPICGSPGGIATEFAGGNGGNGGNGYAGVGGKGGTAAVNAQSGGPGKTNAGQAGGGGGGGGFRGASPGNLYVQISGNLSGIGKIVAVGGTGEHGSEGGKGIPSELIGSTGGGGGGGAGAKLVLRTGGALAFSLSSQVNLTGGKGGTGGNPGQPGPPGYIDYAYLANPGAFGSTCGPASGCTTPLTCQPLSANGLCTTPTCTADADCKFGQAPLGKCIALAAAPLNGGKTCFPPCSSTMTCDRPDFTCDLAKDACVPDCRVQSGGFCPNFKTCDAKTGLCADVACSGTCSAGSICWSNACNTQVCTPDCTAAVSKACAFDVDCPSGVCLAGQCAACPVGTKCQALSKVCVAEGAPPACVP